MAYRTSRFKFLALLTIFFILSMMIAGCTGGQATKGQATTPSEKTYTIKVASNLPINSSNHLLYLNPWMERVTELTNGQVKFEFYPAEQLGKATTMLSALQNKVCDIAPVTPVYFSGEIPLNTIVGLPSLFNTAAEGTKAYQKMLESGPLQDEYMKHGVRTFLAVMMPQYEIVTSKPVTKLEDVKGMKIRVSGGILESNAKAIGGVPVSITSGDTYTALERGTVEGVLGVLQTIADYKWNEVCKYSTIGANLGSAVYNWSIRLDLWNELPQNVKDAMLQAEKEIIDGAKMDAANEEMIKKLEAAGMKFHKISPEEQAKFREALKPVWDKWVNDMKAKGLDGQVVLDTFLKEVEAQRK